MTPWRKPLHDFIYHHLVNNRSFQRFAARTSHAAESALSKAQRGEFGAIARDAKGFLLSTGNRAIDSVSDFVNETRDEAVKSKKTMAPDEKDGKRTVVVMYEKEKEEPIVPGESQEDRNKRLAEKFKKEKIF
jgi:hypothetical protein